MASDRFIHFELGKVPCREDLRKALEDYLGAFMTNIQWGGSRWTAQLMGSKSWPFRRLEPEDCVSAKAAVIEPNEDRWIEVYIAKDNIDVITRRQDWATSQLADGFARLVAQYWQGRLEMEE